jgi:hypothetical protein
VGETQVAPGFREMRRKKTLTISTTSSTTSRTTAKVQSGSSVKEKTLICLHPHAMNRIIAFLASQVDTRSFFLPLLKALAILFPYEFLA